MPVVHIEGRRRIILLPTMCATPSSGVIGTIAYRTVIGVVEMV
jgi:hypothetical protein